MSSLLAKVMDRGIFRVPARRKRLVDAEYAKECALEGMARTQVIWMKEGLIKA